MFAPKFYVALIGAALVFALGFASAWKVQNLRIGKADAQHREQLKALTDQYAAGLMEAERKRAAVEEQARQDAIKAEAEIQKAMKSVRVRTQEVLREVPVYVSADVDRQYPVPVGLVRAYNAAVASAGGDPCPPGSAAEPNSAPSDIALSAVASNHAENLGVCAEWRERALQWQRWYDALRAGWNQPAPAPAQAGAK